MDDLTLQLGDWTLQQVARLRSGPYSLTYTMQATHDATIQLALKIPHADVAPSAWQRVMQREIGLLTRLNERETPGYSHERATLPTRYADAQQTRTQRQIIRLLAVVPDVPVLNGQPALLLELPPPPITDALPLAELAAMQVMLSLAQALQTMHAADILLDDFDPALKLNRIGYDPQAASIKLVDWDGINIGINPPDVRRQRDLVLLGQVGFRLLTAKVLPMRMEGPGDDPVYFMATRAPAEVARDWWRYHQNTRSLIERLVQPRPKLLQAGIAPIVDELAALLDVLHSTAHDDEKIAEPMHPTPPNPADSSPLPPEHPPARWHNAPTEPILPLDDTHSAAHWQPEAPTTPVDSDLAGLPTLPIDPNTPAAPDDSTYASLPPAPALPDVSDVTWPSAPLREAEAVISPMALDARLDALLYRLQQSHSVLNVLYSLGSSMQGVPLRLRERRERLEQLAQALPRLSAPDLNVRQRPLQHMADRYAVPLDMYDENEDTPARQACLQVMAQVCAAEYALAQALDARLPIPSRLPLLEELIASTHPGQDFPWLSAYYERLHSAANELRLTLIGNLGRELDQVLRYPQMPNRAALDTINTMWQALSQSQREQPHWRDLGTKRQQVLRHIAEQQVRAALAAGRVADAAALLDAQPNLTLEASPLLAHAHDLHEALDIATRPTYDADPGTRLASLTAYVAAQLQPVITALREVNPRDASSLTAAHDLLRALADANQEPELDAQYDALAARLQAGIAALPTTLDSRLQAVLATCADWLTEVAADLLARRLRSLDTNDLGRLRQQLDYLQQVAADNPSFADLPDDIERAALAAMRVPVQATDASVRQMAEIALLPAVSEAERHKFAMLLLHRYENDLERLALVLDGSPLLALMEAALQRQATQRLRLRIAVLVLIVIIGGGVLLALFGALSNPPQTAVVLISTTPSPTATVTETPPPTGTASSTPSITPTETQTPTPSITPTHTASSTPSATLTDTLTPTRTPSATRIPSATPQVARTAPVPFNPLQVTQARIRVGPVLGEPRYQPGNWVQLISPQTARRGNVPDFFTASATLIVAPQAEINVISQNDLRLLNDAHTRLSLLAPSLGYVLAGPFAAKYFWDANQTYWYWVRISAVDETGQRRTSTGWVQQDELTAAPLPAGQPQPLSLTNAALPIGLQTDENRAGQRVRVRGFVRQTPDVGGVSNIINTSPDAEYLLLRDVRDFGGALRWVLVRLGSDVTGESLAGWAMAEDL